MSKTPHKHAELIKAWADGAEIEYKLAGHWVVVRGAPNWGVDNEYRVKPEPKPDFSIERWVYGNGATEISVRRNIRFTFDGETGKLKKAEVLE